MKKLVIKAHPNRYGFTHKIADTFVLVSQKCGHELCVIDLYDPSLRQDFLLLDEHNKPLVQNHVTQMQELISWADELVFIYPVWWYDAPAIIKNWFDLNFSAGFAYKYKKGSLLPDQFLRGKSARFFVTT
jgi:NAD(P)H dehydrogenase (quinone)